MAKGETSSAPSTPTESIAATMSSPVTCAGPCSTERHGRPGWLRSYACTCESMIAMAFTPAHYCSTGTVALRTTTSQIVPGLALDRSRVTSPRGTILIADEDEHEHVDMLAVARERKGDAAIVHV